MAENPAAVPPDPEPISLDSAATRAGSAGPAAFLRDALAPGALLAGRYRIGRFLARGGMGEVHEARDELLDVTLALKTLRLDLEGDPLQLRRFKRELLLARSITHPNVCRMYDLEVDRSTRRVLFFLTMELLGGETLRARILARGRLAAGEALPLVRQMATALGAAHAAGVVHRDFKSGNVMLVPGSAGERVVVTDFGIACLDQGAGRALSNLSDVTRLGDLLGTPAYMAPEQVRGEPAGPAADVYALGVVLFEMVTGRLPFEGATPIETARRKLTEDPPSPRALVADLEPGWEGTILRCIAREPGARFASAAEVAAALAGDVVASTPSRRVLPAERDAFVGRGAALDELARRLELGARLVTLVGPGGTGKTRLAARHGWSARPSYPGGVWFCDLTAARSRDGIASAVASALGVALGKGDPIVQLGHAIAGRGLALFILDNFEQVVEHAAATVGRWLERAPEARFVVTSRERLGLAGEETQALEPLDEEEGVALFLTRAREYRPEFGSEGSEGEGVRQVVRLVDGLPLAIELAAARMRMLGIGQIVERLKDRFRLLAGGTGEGRHATLRAAIDSSWELLEPWERAAFAQCAVFEGGFTLEAAEAVLELGRCPEAPWVVDVVQALVDKSLLRMLVPEGGSGEPRFAMFVSLHEYAAEKLRTEGAVPSGGSGAEAERAVAERHGRHYAGSGTDKAIAALETHGGVARRQAMALELDNLVAACRQAVVRRDGPTAVRTLAAARTVLELKGPYALGEELGRQVLGLGSLGPADRGHALRSLAAGLRDAGQWDEARKHFDEALAIARATGDRSAEGIVLGRLGGLHSTQGRMDEALQHFQEALAIHRESGDRPPEGVVLGHLGLVHKFQGRIDQALRYYHDALVIHRAVGNRRFEGIVLGNLGNLHQEQGRMEEALRHYQDALSIHREVGDRGYEGKVLGHLGVLHHLQGRMEEALRHYHAARAIHREVGNRRMEGNVVSNLGVLLDDEDRIEEALRHYQEALAIAREIGDRRAEGIVLGYLGNFNHDRGRMEEAVRCNQEALAIAREVGDRSSEGVLLGNLGALHASRGRLEEAREALAAGEALLRAVNSRDDLGVLLCHRGECERLADDIPAARDRLREAEAIAQALAVGPDAEFGKKIARLRAALADSSAPSRD
jgi:predicted ATPase/Tfp pilus assembly protein PilF